MKCDETIKFQRLLLGLRHVGQGIHTLQEDDGPGAEALEATVDRDVLQHATPQQQLFALRELRGEAIKVKPLAYYDIPADGPGLKSLRHNLQRRAQHVADQIRATVPPMPRDKIADMGDRARMQQAMAGGQSGSHDWRADPPIPPKLRIRGDAGTLRTLGGKVPLKVGIASAQGRRHTMEDVHLADIQDGLAVVGIFDGHTGKTVAQALSHELLPALQTFVTPGAEPHAMRHALKNLFASKAGAPVDFRTLDAAVDEYGHGGGSTALIALIDADRFYIANVGDSRAVLVDPAGKGQRMSVDQSAVGMEYERIYKNGGRVIGARVDGSLAMGRAVGDWTTEGIARRPQVTAGHVDHGQCLIMACDGFWNVISDEASARMAHEMFAAGMPADAVAENLTRAALACKTSDNVTVAVLQLRGAQG